MNVVLAGRFRLDKKISFGGYGEVWRAFDDETRECVAVKRINAQLH